VPLGLAACQSAPKESSSGGFVFVAAGLLTDLDAPATTGVVGAKC